MELKDITLNTMATVGVLRQVDLSTDLAKVFCQTKTRIEDADLWDQETREFNANLNDLIEVIENTGLDVYGTGGEPMEKPTETIPATVWSEDEKSRPRSESRFPWRPISPPFMTCARRRGTKAKSTRPLLRRSIAGRQVDSTLIDARY
jgi:hypothetical protein